MALATGTSRTVNIGSSAKPPEAAGGAPAGAEGAGAVAEEKAADPRVPVTAAGAPLGAAGTAGEVEELRPLPHFRRPVASKHANAATPAKNTVPPTAPPTIAPTGAARLSCKGRVPMEGRFVERSEKRREPSSP